MARTTSNVTNDAIWSRTSRDFLSGKRFKGQRRSRSLPTAGTFERFAIARVKGGEWKSRGAFLWNSRYLDAAIRTIRRDRARHFHGYCSPRSSRISGVNCRVGLRPYASPFLSPALPLPGPSSFRPFLCRYSLPTAKAKVPARSLFLSARFSFGYRLWPYHSTTHTQSCPPHPYTQIYLFLAWWSNFA